MPDWVPINWALIKNPVNWAIILLMVVFFGLVIDLFLIFWSPPKTVEE